MQTRCPNFSRRPAPAVVASAVEALEPRQLRTAAYPTPAEQYAVELINRARANPTAEALLYVGYSDGHGNTYDGDINEGLPAGTISADAKQPLAINPALTDAARDHSDYMIANSVFSHYGANNIDPGERIDAAGYPYDSTRDWGENIAINYSSGTLNAATVVLDQQRSLFTDQSITLRGHRTNMLEPTRNEIGVGLAAGPYDYANYGTLNAITATHDTATNGTVFLTGVAYTDGVSDDNFYSVGEGLGGVAVTATAADGTVYGTTTWDSGGYSLAVPAGTYTVRGSAATIGGVIAYDGVTVGTENVKRDFVTGSPGDGGTVEVAKARVRDRTLVITGTSGNDVVGVYVDPVTHRYLAGINGGTRRFAASLVDDVSIKVGAGNDRVVIGDGVTSAYVEGGLGKDTLIGGAGSDTLYGNGGNDRVEGNGGNDSLVGENGNDVIYAGSGNDRIYGGAGDDTIDTGPGNDRAYGGVGDDYLIGGKGRDILIGETGADTLNGGASRDITDTDDNDTRIATEVLQ